MGTHLRLRLCHALRERHEAGADARAERQQQDGQAAAGGAGRLVKADGGGRGGDVIPICVRRDEGEDEEDDEEGRQPDRDRDGRGPPQRATPRKVVARVEARWRVVGGVLHIDEDVVAGRVVERLDEAFVGVCRVVGGEACEVCNPNSNKL